MESDCPPEELWLGRAGSEELIRKGKVKDHYYILSENIPKKMP